VLAELRRKPVAIPAALLLLSCALFSGAQFLRGQASDSLLPGPKPPDAPPAIKQWIGEYGPDGPMLSTVGEKAGSLLLFGDAIGTCSIPNSSGSELSANCSLQDGVSLAKDEKGAPSLRSKTGTFPRRDLGVDANQVARIHPLRPVAELRAGALKASPPHEKGPFRAADLVELAPLDPAIHLDIRYATNNDFLGTPVYTQARAFLQRPAAEALLRAHRKLLPLGYGLLIHDAYRPWYVTKIFWDATPQEGKIFVADPSQGSRHNRGCAVDLSIYDLHTGKPIEMPGTYDEMSRRSYPTYAGGTSLQRWHRDLLRRAMESEGFAVYEFEWWHFDYKDWKEYAIQNTPFEHLAPANNP
jgi:D-alanyl-D-alanine dipeptidase